MSILWREGVAPLSSSSSLQPERLSCQAVEFILLAVHDGLKCAVSHMPLEVFDMAHPGCDG